MDPLIAMFCDIDDFCKRFEPLYQQRLLQGVCLSKGGGPGDDITTR